VLIHEDGSLYLNFDEELVRETCVSHQGEFVSKRVKDFYKEK